MPKCREEVSRLSRSKRPQKARVAEDPELTPGGWLGKEATEAGTALAGYQREKEREREGKLGTARTGDEREREREKERE